MKDLYAWVEGESWSNVPSDDAESHGSPLNGTMTKGVNASEREAQWADIYMKFMAKRQLRYVQKNNEKQRDV